MENFLYFALIGFFAQLINGVLGMAYRISVNLFLLSIGIPLPIVQVMYIFLKYLFLVWFTTLLGTVTLTEFVISLVVQVHFYYLPNHQLESVFGLIK